MFNEFAAFQRKKNGIRIRNPLLFSQASAILNNKDFQNFCETFIHYFVFTGCGSMAHAASPIYSWEWTTEGTQITAPGWNGSFNYTTGNDYATFGSGSGGGTPYNSGIAGISGSFTVSFDLKNLSSTNNAWKDVFSLYSNGTVSGESNSMVLEFNASGELYFTTRDLEANPAETSIQA